MNRLVVVLIVIIVFLGISVFYLFSVVESNGHEPDDELFRGLLVSDIVDRIEYLESLSAPGGITQEILIQRLKSSTIIDSHDLHEIVEWYIYNGGQKLISFLIEELNVGCQVNMSPFARGTEYYKFKPYLPDKFLCVNSKLLRIQKLDKPFLPRIGVTRELSISSENNTYFDILNSYFGKGDVIIQKLLHDKLYEYNAISRDPQYAYLLLQLLRNKNRYNSVWNTITIAENDLLACLKIYEDYSEYPYIRFSVYSYCCLEKRPIDGIDRKFVNELFRLVDEEGLNRAILYLNKERK